MVRRVWVEVAVWTRGVGKGVWNGVYGLGRGVWTWMGAVGRGVYTPPPPPETATHAVGTYPTVMYSC